MKYLLPILLLLLLSGCAPMKKSPHVTVIPSINTKGGTTAPQVVTETSGNITRIYIERREIK